MVVLLLEGVAGRYGWHRDELYFLAAGKQPAWGYVDQPPFTPIVARIADELATGNLWLLRLLPAVTTATTAIIAGLVAHELGGSRRTQVASALAMATGGYAMGAGHLLSTAAFDLTAWMALLWIVARLLRTGDTRLWVAFGGVAGVALLNKDLVPLLAAALAFGMLVERRWDLLWTGWLPVGVGLAVLIALPNLLWQADHGWPQGDMARVLSERLGGENRATLVPVQLVFIGPFLVPALWRGAGWLRDRPRGRPLLWAWPAALIATLLAAGRPYYVLPLTLVVVIAGIVATDEPGREGSRRRLPAVLRANGIGVLLISLPLLPISALDTVPIGDLNESAVETIGWPELTEQVAGVVRDLPAAEQDGVVLLAASYGEAGALDRFGPDHGLPPAFSPQNSYPDLRWPTDDAATVVAIRFDRSYLDRYFDECAEVARVNNGLDVENEAQGTPIHVCRGLRGTWADLEGSMRYLS